MSHDIAYHDEANTFSVLIGSKQNANPGQFKAEQPAPWEYRAKLVIKEYPKSIDEFLKVFVASEERCPHIKSKGLFQSSNGFKGQGDDFAQQLVEGLNAMSFELPEAKGLDFVNTVGETIVFRDEDNVTQGPASSPAIVASYPGIRFQGGRVPKWHQISIALQVRLRKDEDPVGRYANRDEETLFELLQTARNILVTGRTLFAFVVGIYGNTARIFRVDRTGVVVSQSFNYIVRPNLFREFLWRFTHPTVGGMFVGADPSVSLPTEQDLHWARQILHKQNMTDVYLEASRWVAIEMPDKSRKKFLTAKPASISLDLFARGTNVCLVIQQSSTNGKLQVLKESWCDTKHEPEIKFYEEIRVRNPGKLFGVADFICGQDLGKAETDRLVALGTASGTLPAAASTQNAAPRLTIRLPAARIARTRMQTRSSKNDCPPPPVAPGHNTVAHWDHRKHAADHANRRSHMRLLYNTIGRELTNITSTRELAEGIRDAIKGHRTVFEAGVLHRDISEGNVMIADGEEFKGFIHDFDMAMLRENEPDRSGAIYGTYYFRSLRLQENKGVVHNFEHDLESFYWVLIHQVLSLCQHDHKKGTNAYAWLFSPYDNKCVEHRTLWLYDPSHFLNVTGNVPLTFLEKEFRILCKDNLLSYEAVLDIFDEALKMDGWPEEHEEQWEPWLREAGSSAASTTLGKRRRESTDNYERYVKRQRESSEV